MQSLSDVPSARPSSTVVLVRENEDAPELLMMQRHERSSFGGAFAFPGGVLEPADHAVAEWCDGVTESEATRLLGDDDGLAYFSAAIRELFEESGVLLASLGAPDVNLDAARDALNAGELDWARFVEDNEIRLHCADLHYFSFWITPVVLPRRYSTRFFLAAMPDEQEAVHCGRELTDSCWISAGAALEAERQGSMSIHFPTIKTLEALAQHATVDELIAWAAAESRAGVPCIFPKISHRDSKRRVIVSGEDAGELK
jgi:8-oxo-dGTP pyrophosphatase MutT (NUDIX family)